MDIIDRLRMIPITSDDELMTLSDLRVYQWSRSVGVEHQHAVLLADAVTAFRERGVASANTAASGRTACDNGL